MTTVFHTADVHLSADAPERTEALRRVLDRADAAGADAVTIGGDLFDRPADVEDLRTDLRNDLFADRPFDVLLIPGNHDVAAFRGDVFFGDACTVLATEPYAQWTAPDGDLRVTGLPYHERATDDLLLALGDREPFAGADVLLLHCSLDAPFGDDETGGEDAHRYFPVSEDVLVDLGFDYYLAGHYHSPHRREFASGATFTYPGTPASTKRTETGRRRVATLDPDVGLGFEALDTVHYEHREFTATPGREDDLLDAVRDWADQYAVPSAAATVRVDGFVERGEDEFHAALEAAADPAAVVDDTRGVQRVLSRPLFRAFEAELDARDWDDEEKAAVWTRTVEVYSRLAAGREF